MSGNMIGQKGVKQEVCILQVLNVTTQHKAHMSSRHGSTSNFNIHNCCNLNETVPGSIGYYSRVMVLRPAPEHICVTSNSVSTWITATSTAPHNILQVRRIGDDVNTQI
jgi:hypothetical protein